MTLLGTTTNNNTISNKGKILLQNNNGVNGKINNNLTITNDSFLICDGEIRNYKTGTITNNEEIQIKKTLLNYGILTNNKTIQSFTSSTFENFNILTNAVAGTVTLNESFYNKENVSPII